MDAEGMEKRRLEGLRLLRQGLNQNQVALRLGVTRGAVNHWVKAYQNGGKKALHAHPREGRPPKLTPRQMGQIPGMLLKRAMVHGYPDDLWTTERVAWVVEQKFGVRYHPGHVWRLLHDLGFTWQKPRRQALERDEKAINQWLREEWPKIQKKGVGNGP